MDAAQRPAIRDTGFTVLYAPPEEKPVADIVLVHGLQGSPRGTWSFTSPEIDHSKSDPAAVATDKKSRRRSLNFKTILDGFSRKRNSLPLIEAQPTQTQAQPARRIHWPADLLPTDCPGVRILVWGYDSKVTKGYNAANKSNLFSHARDLLYGLERDRPPGRPIIFVAHSLGGLLVKEVLRRSQFSDDPALQDIVRSTRSIVFLGTPHRGSANYAGLGELARKVASTVLRVDSNAAILRALGLDSPELELSRESFIQQWRTYNFEVKTFQESLAPNGMNLRGANEKIVPDMSSSLDDPRERAETLQGDHRNMTKFWGPEDPNYLKVSGELRRIIAIIQHELVSRKEEQTILSPIVDEPDPTPALSRQEQDCLKTLAFSVMMNRQQNIREAMDNTCGWFYSSDQYKTWYSRESVSIDHGLLWIKGKPGAGKSTIMKNAVYRTESKERPHSTVAAFYFNARGSPLERNPLGLFRSILHQICLQDSKVFAEFLQLYIERQKAALNADEWSWSRIELETFIKRIFSKLKPQQTFIFVDALDECDENTVREIVHLFAEIGTTAFEKGLNLRICLSSRHYPTISIPNCPEIMVEGANTGDIATYIQAKFKFIAPGEEEVVKDLEKDIIEKASGVFLWAVLVVDLLLRDVDTGQPVSVITERLKSVPKRMEDLYAELCCSLKPEEKTFSLRLFQCVLLSTPMTIENVCLGALFSTPGSWDNLISWGYIDDQVPPTERLVRHLKNASRGLLEYASDRVQFIHETAREFFLTGPGLGILDPTIKENPIGLSNKAWVMSAADIIEFPLEWKCLEYLRDYAKHNIMVSARAAEGLGVSMVDLLDRITASSKLWDKLPHWKDGSVIHFMTEQRLTSCVLACLERGVHPDDNNEWTNHTPLVAAVSKGISGGDLTPLIVALIKHGANLETRGANNNTPFLIALKSGQPDLADILRRNGADINAVNDSGECALHIILHLKSNAIYPKEAAEYAKGLLKLMNQNRKEFEDLFDALIASNVALEARAWAGSTPLHYAASIGDVEAVRKLVENGADVHAKNEMGNPLFSAVNCPSADAAQICDILMKGGADIHEKDGKNRTVLHHAARSAHHETVVGLIEAGVDPNVVDDNGQNACHRAVERRRVSVEVIRALVNAGCDIMARDNTWRTPLQTLMDYNGMSKLDDEILLLLQGTQTRRAPTWEQWVK